MSTPIFPTAYKVEVKGIYFGQLTENVWYVQGPDPFDESVALAVAGIFQTGYAALMAGQSQDMSINEIAVSNLGGTATGTTALTISPAQQGGRVQDGEPGNVAICISLRTALSGRRFRGRKYFSGLGKGDVTGNQFNLTQLGVMLSGIAGMVSDLNTNGTPLSVFSPTGLTLVPVNNVNAVDNFVDSQSRRLTGRGR